MWEPVWDCLTWESICHPPQKVFDEKGSEDKKVQVRPKSQVTPMYNAIKKKKKERSLKRFSHIKLTLTCHYCTVRSEKHAWKKLIKSSSSETTPAQEKHILTGLSYICNHTYTSDYQNLTAAEKLVTVHVPLCVPSVAYQKPWRTAVNRWKGWETK